MIPRKKMVNPLLRPGDSDRCAVVRDLTAVLPRTDRSCSLQILAHAQEAYAVGTIINLYISSCLLYPYLDWASDTYTPSTCLSAFAMKKGKLNSSFLHRGGQHVNMLACIMQLWCGIRRIWVRIAETGMVGAEGNFTTTASIVQSCGCTYE